VLKQYLANMTREELIEEIQQLNSRFRRVKEYYQARLEPHKTEDALVAYKERVKREFFTRTGNPGPLRLGMGRKAVQEFAKVQANITHQIDLELFYVEQGVKFTNSFGDIDEPFYMSIESMFERALKNIKKHNLENMFVDRAEKIVRDTSGIGWGFADSIEYLYSQYFKQ
jgi:hypothetical protein